MLRGPLAVGVLAAGAILGCSEQMQPVETCELGNHDEGIAEIGVDWHGFDLDATREPSVFEDLRVETVEQDRVMLQGGSSLVIKAPQLELADLFAAGATIDASLVGEGNGNGALVVSSAGQPLLALQRGGWTWSFCEVAPTIQEALKSSDITFELEAECEGAYRTPCGEMKGASSYKLAVSSPQGRVTMTSRSRICVAGWTIIYGGFAFRQGGGDPAVCHSEGGSDSGIVAVRCPVGCCAD